MGNPALAALLANIGVLCLVVSILSLLRSHILLIRQVRDQGRIIRELQRTTEKKEA